MTSRERVLAALRREDVDYVPCCPFFNALHEQQRVEHRYQFPWGPSQREVVEYCLRGLGVDQLVHYGLGTHHYPAAGVSARAWMEDSVIHKVWHTPAGDLHAAITYNEKWPHGFNIPFFSDFNIGHYVEPWLECEQDLECLRHILRPPESKEALAQWRFEYEEAKRLAERLQVATMTTIGLGLSGALLLTGPEAMCLMAVENPDLLDAYLELEHQLNLSWIERMAETGVDIIRRNGFYETADFLGPSMLERFLAQRLNREIDAAHQAGILTAYTVNTGIMPMLDHLRKLNFDCLLQIDVAFHGVDMQVIRDSQGDSKSFWLGPSGVYHMWSKDPETVREAVREVFAVFGKRGLLLTPCPTAHSIMPWENTLAMIDEWKMLRGT